MSKRTTIRLKLQPAWGVVARVLVALSVSGSAAQAQTTPLGNIQATAASLDAPAGIAYDTAGNLYIADLNHNAIREVSVAGIITTIAGTENKASLAMADRQPAHCSIRPRASPWMLPAMFILLTRTTTVSAR